MRNFCGVVCAWLVLAFCALGYGAAPQASLEFSDALRDGGWEAVLVKIDVPAGGGVLWVRDARGGLEIGRPVDGGEGREVLVSLPLLAAEGLRVPDGTVWSLRVRVAPSGAEMNLPDAQALTITHAEEGEPRRSLRIAIPAGRGPSDLAVLRPLEPFVLASIAEDEIRAAPPLSLAGCDAIFLDDGLVGRISPERATALMACGVRLIYAGSSVPGALSDFTWATLPNSSLRIAPLEFAALSPPRVVEPALAAVRISPPRLAAGMKAALLALTPAVVLLVLLARIFTPRPAVIVAILAVALIGGSAITILVLQGNLEPTIERVTWHTRPAPGNVLIHETLLFRGALYGESTDMTSTDPVPLLPLASTPASWLAQTDGRLLLDTPTSATPRVARFSGPTLARQTRAYLSRSVARQYPLPANPGDPLWQEHLGDHHVDLAHGFDVVGGQVRAAGSAGAPEVITAWMGHLPPPLRRAVEAWYQLRFDPRRRYHLEPRDAGLFVVDFGIPAEGP